MNKAFTLIELLVVVLIIGILAAVALPQYEKAVWKSKANQLQLLVKSLAEAQQTYYLANNEYAKEFSSLDIGFNSLPSHPATAVSGNTVASADAVRSNDEVELMIVINPATYWVNSEALFKKGPYAQAGFGFCHESVIIPNNRLYCEEHKSITEGNFCKKVMGLNSNSITTDVYSYRYFPM